jgi:hypothetical protein
MDILHHPSVTRRFGPPSDWDEKVAGACGTLEICDHLQQPGNLQTMQSLWRPDAEELKLLNQGCAIILNIVGTVHPVVSMGVTMPGYVDQ